MQEQSASYWATASDNWPFNTVLSPQEFNQQLGMNIMRGGVTAALAGWNAQLSGAYELPQIPSAR